MTELAEKAANYFHLDPVILSIGEKWFLLMVTFVLNIADIQAVFGIFATIAVIIYTAYRTLNQREELKERRKKSKEDGTPNSN